jgi:hypothetical protein
MTDDLLHRLEAGEGSRERYSGSDYFIAFYMGPARISWNCLYPKRGRWNFRFIWAPIFWRDWGINWPSPRKFRYAKRLRALKEPGDE